jgi:hypothetical protein
MRVLNFSYPLTGEQRARIQDLTGHPVECVLDVATQFDAALPFAEQAAALVDRVGLSAAEWQTTGLLVNLPSHADIAGLLLAELHGRTGHFPTVLRLRPVPGSMPVTFEVAELLSLQEVRDRARLLR